MDVSDRAPSRVRARRGRGAPLQANLPDRTGNATLARRFNQSSRWFPPPVLWLAIGLVALAVRRSANALALSAPAIAAFMVIVLSALAIAAIPHYSVPVTPAFALLGAAALLGPVTVRRLVQAAADREHDRGDRRQ